MGFPQIQALFALIFQIICHVRSNTHRPFDDITRSHGESFGEKDNNFIGGCSNQSNCLDLDDEEIYLSQYMSDFTEETFAKKKLSEDIPLEKWLYDFLDDAEKEISYLDLKAL